MRKEYRSTIDGSVVSGFFYGDMAGYDCLWHLTVNSAHRVKCYAFDGNLFYRAKSYIMTDGQLRICVQEVAILDDSIDCVLRMIVGEWQPESELRELRI